MHCFRARVLGVRTFAQGDSVNDIAGKLALSSKTISTHKARLMQKLAAHSVADPVRYAMEHKLV